MASLAEERVGLAQRYHDRGIDECYTNENHDQAILDLRQAIVLRESVHGKHHTDTATSYFRLACVLREYAEAIRRNEVHDAHHQHSSIVLQPQFLLKAALVAARRELRISSHIFFAGIAAARSSGSTLSSGSDNDGDSFDRMNDEEDTIFSMISDRVLQRETSSKAADETIYPQINVDAPVEEEFIKRINKKELDDEWLIERIQWIHRALEDLEMSDPSLLSHYKKQYHVHQHRESRQHSREQDRYCEKLLQSIEYERMGDKHFAYQEAGLALSQYNCALSLEKDAYARNLLDQADLHYKMGDCLVLLEDYTSAMDEYQMAMDLYNNEYSIKRTDFVSPPQQQQSKRHGETQQTPHDETSWPLVLVYHGTVAKCLSKLAGLHLKMQHFDTALATFSKSFTIWESLVGVGHEYCRESLQDTRLVVVKEMEYLRKREKEKQKRARSIQMRSPPPKPIARPRPTNSVMIRGPEIRDVSVSSRNSTVQSTAREVPIHQRAPQPSLTAAARTTTTTMIPTPRQSNRVNPRFTNRVPFKAPSSRLRESVRFTGSASITHATTPPKKPPQSPVNEPYRIQQQAQPQIQLRPQQQAQQQVQSRPQAQPQAQLQSRPQAQSPPQPQYAAIEDDRDPCESQRAPETPPSRSPPKPMQQKSPKNRHSFYVPVDPPPAAKISTPPPPIQRRALAARARQSPASRLAPRISTYSTSPSSKPTRSSSPSSSLPSRDPPSYSSRIAPPSPRYDANRQRAPSSPNTPYVYSSPQKANPAKTSQQNQERLGNSTSSRQQTINSTNGQRPMVSYRTHQDGW